MWNTEFHRETKERGTQRVYFSGYLFLIFSVKRKSADLARIKTFDSFTSFLFTVNQITQHFHHTIFIVALGYEACNIPNVWMCISHGI
jgi:hypothetical protein